MKSWIVALVAVLAGIAISILLITSATDIAEELRLPLLAVISVVTIMAALSFVATVFRHADLATTQHALGLPEGSVRALIALSLIIVFTVITLFVLVRFSRIEVVCVECTPSLVEDAGTPATSTVATTSTFGTTDTITSEPTSTSVTDMPSGAATNAATTSPRDTTAPRGSTTPARAPSPALDAAIAKRMESAQDLAKQLLTMLGTLLAAISSFYFGASSTAAASDPTKMRETIRVIDEMRGRS